jgi:ureidoglycolate lyase/seryl-tRNA synthetase
MAAPVYSFEVSDKPSLPLHPVPLVIASADTVEPFGCLVDEADGCEVEIVRWPARGWRPVDDGTGDEGGTVEGIFTCRWTANVLRATNAAVAGDYVLGWSGDPQSTGAIAPTAARASVTLWHLNYHPDGGQLFMPLEPAPFVVPVASPGDDISPDDVVALWCDGSRGLYIHPDIWHDGVFPSSQEQRFLTRQGRVHARVSCDFGEEFGCYLSVPLVPGTVDAKTGAASTDPAVP